MENPIIEMVKMAVGRADGCQKDSPVVREEHIARILILITYKKKYQLLGTKENCNIESFSFVQRLLSASNSYVIA